MCIKLICFYYFQCYRRILQLDPENVQGLHNLCVVFVERGNLRKAEACLKEAHKLAPKEDYIIRHLKIVQQRLYQSNAKMARKEPPAAGDSQQEEDHEISKYLRESQVSGNVGSDADEKPKCDGNVEETSARDEYKKKTPVKALNSEPLLNGDFKAEASTTYVQQKQRAAVPSQYASPVPQMSKPVKRRQNILSGHDLDEVSLS